MTTAATETTHTDRVITYSEAVREAIGQAMEADERVFMLGEDIGIYGGAFGVSGDLYHRFGGDRIRDTPISERAAGYGIPGVTVDGNDLDAVHEAVSAAVTRARAGDGPTLVENVTYRWKGHSKSDKNLYRTREEIAEWRAQDPIIRFEASIREAGLLSDEDIQHTRTQALEDMRSDVREANAAPDADPSDLLDAVFARA